MSDQERLADGLAAIADVELKVHEEAMRAPAMLDALEAAMGDAMMPLVRTHVESRIDRLRVSILSMRARIMLSESSVRSLTNRAFQSEKGMELSKQALAFNLHTAGSESVNIPLDEMIPFSDSHTIHMQVDKPTNALVVTLVPKRKPE